MLLKNCDVNPKNMKDFAQICIGVFATYFLQYKNYKIDSTNMQMIRCHSLQNGTII